MSDTQIVTEPSADTVETWMNVTKGRVVINRIGALGQRRAEMIGAEKRFHITAQERRMNQEAAANADLDVFLNGTLQPVNLPEGTDEDYSAITENPNLLGDDAQVMRLFRATDDVFAERLAEIKNASALERLRDLALRDETGAKVSQLRMVEARLAQVLPAVDSIHSAEAAGSGPEARGGRDTIKAVTPK